MKRMLSLVLAALLLVSVLSLTACGSAYAGIEKNFVDAGFEVVENDDADDLLKITAGVEEGEVSCTIHVLKRGALLKGDLAYAMILEFDGDDDAKAALAEYMEDENLKIVLEDLDSTKIVNKNCMIIPVVLNLDIEDTLTEMLDLFNK